MNELVYSQFCETPEAHLDWSSSSIDYYSYHYDDCYHGFNFVSIHVTKFDTNFNHGKS